MNNFTVIYVIEAEGIQWQFFNCLADNAGHFASLVPGTCDWKDSLVKRPE